MVDPFVQQLFLSRWSGAPAQGQLPQVPSRAVLDTASAELAGCLVRIPGGSGVADATYECQKQAAGTYAWVQIDGGSTGPLGLLASATATVNGITTTTTIASVAVNVGNSRAIRMIADVELQSSAVSTNLQLQFQQDSVAQNTFNYTTPSVATGSQAMTFTWLVKPTAGNHTYAAVLLAPATGSAAVFTQFAVEDVGAA